MSTASALATGAEAGYWEGLEAGKLCLQKCAKCGAPHWPAVWRCSDCGSWEHVWGDVAMRGEIYTWTRNWHPFGGLEHLAKPFVIVVVSIENGGGARLMGILEGDAPDIAIGRKVTGQAVRTPYGDRDMPTIRWTLA